MLHRELHLGLLGMLLHCEEREREREQLPTVLRGSNVFINSAANAIAVCKMSNVNAAVSSP
jgi:hypothetical protein